MSKQEGINAISSVIKEHIDVGITLADAVNFLVDKYELVRIDRRGFSWQEQSPYLRVVDSHCITKHKLNELFLSRNLNLLLMRAINVFVTQITFYRG